MDNPETLATLGTQDAGRRQTLHKNKTQKIKKMSNTNHTGCEPRFSGKPIKNIFDYFEQSNTKNHNTENYKHEKQGPQQKTGG
jgi:hypothetical protein